MSDNEYDESFVGGGHDCIPTLAESPLMANALGVYVDSNRK